MPDLDPITQVHNALATLLAGIVKPSNLVTYTGAARLPVKDETTTSDLPEMRLVPVASVPHIQRTSTGSSIVKRWEIHIKTGDRRVDAVLFPLEWAIYRTMGGWYAALASLTWGGVTFVKLCRPTAVTNREELRDMAGWVSVWAVEVELWFKTVDLAV